MIIDQIANSHLYYMCNPRVKRAFEYLEQTDLSAISVGKYEIEDNDLYALVSQYSTKPKEQCTWEAHRRYIDLQYIIKGKERIGYTHLKRLTQGEYDEKKDTLTLTGEGDFLTLSSGSFIILMPTDGHMPGIALNMPCIVKKVVIKISVE